MSKIKYLKFYYDDPEQIDVVEDLSYTFAVAKYEWLCHTELKRTMETLTDIFNKCIHYTGLVNQFYELFSGQIAKKNWDVFSKTIKCNVFDKIRLLRDYMMGRYGAQHLFNLRVTICERDQIVDVSIMKQTKIAIEEVIFYFNIHGINILRNYRVCCRWMLERLDKCCDTNDRVSLVRNMLESTIGLFEKMLEMLEQFTGVLEEYCGELIRMIDGVTTIPTKVEDIPDVVDFDCVKLENRDCDTEYAYIERSTTTPFSFEELSSINRIDTE